MRAIRPSYNAGSGVELLRASLRCSRLSREAIESLTICSSVNASTAAEKQAQYVDGALGGVNFAQSRRVVSRTACAPQTSNSCRTSAPNSSVPISVSGARTRPRFAIAGGMQSQKTVLLISAARSASSFVAGGSSSRRTHWLAICSPAAATRLPYDTAVCCAVAQIVSSTLTRAISPRVRLISIPSSAWQCLTVSHYAARMAAAQAGHGEGGRMKRAALGFALVLWGAAALGQ